MILIMIGVKVQDQTDSNVDENMTPEDETAATVSPNAMIGGIDISYFRQEALNIAKHIQSSAGNVDNLLENAERILRYLSTGDTKDEAMVEIGGQRMTQKQFEAARFPLLNSSGDTIE